MSSRRPPQIEKRIFEIVEKIKANIDSRELCRWRDSTELRRRKTLLDNCELIDAIADQVTQGASINDLAVKEVTREEMQTAAGRYLPSHRRAYVRLALEGR